MRRLAVVMVLAGALVWTLAAQTEDAALGQIRAALAPMRANPLANVETRGATAEFDGIKHQLRDWIEPQLAGVKPGGDVGAVQRKLNEELERAGLRCNANPGCLGEIKLRWESEFLVVQTGVGIQNCGFDESAYAYRWAGERWQRFWQDEENDYSEKKYAPRYIDRVQFSPTPYGPGADKNQRLVLAIGRHGWCTSVWQPVYYRVWQVSSRLKEPKLLLDESKIVTWNDPVEGSVGADEVVVEFSVDGVNGTPHREVRHYVLSRSGLRRVDPIVLRPRDFADVWIRSPWAQSAHWTDARARPQVEQWHQRNERTHGDFIEVTLHCVEKPDLWQVGIDFSDPEDESDEGEEYFLIRWRPPYHFTMVDVSEYPWPDCSEEDREADEPRTLFLGGWH